MLNDKTQRLTKFWKNIIRNLKRLCESLVIRKNLGSEKIPALYRTFIIDYTPRLVQSICRQSALIRRLPSPAVIKSALEFPTQEVKIFSSVKELQQKWIQADGLGDKNANHQTQITISRLKDLVDIAKSLNSAVSRDAIFSQVQQVVFRNFQSVERLALLVDTQGSGQLELLNAAARDVSIDLPIATDGSWISHSICQKAFTKKVAIKTADAQKDRRFNGEDSILGKGIRSALAVPLWDKNLVVGVLYADACIDYNPWNQGGDEDLSFFSALGNIMASAVQRWLLTQKLRSEEAIRQRLERYHSPAVVQHIMTGGVLEGGRLTPVEADISVLFADLVGFTALSQELSPAQTSQLLNSFFEEMLQEVFAVGGTLDKFIGDCIMAFWGAPEPQADHADRALIVAKRMLSRLAHLNACGAFYKPLQLRIAINSGKALVGDVGSSQRVDYTVLGTTINLASRMQHICPPGEFVVSEATFARLTQKQGFLGMKQYHFKGIDQPVGIYHPIRLFNKSLSVKSSPNSALLSKMKGRGGEGERGSSPRACFQTSPLHSDPPKSSLKRGTLTEFYPLFQGRVDSFS